MHRKRKWSSAQRTKFIATMKSRRENHEATTRVNPHSHFYRFKNGKLLPVKVKRMTLLVLA